MTTIKKETEQESTYVGGTTCTPYWFLRDGEKHHITNLVQVGIGDIKVVERTNQRERDSVAKVLCDLRKNDYKFVCYQPYGEHDSLPELLTWIDENDKTVDIHIEPFNNSTGSFTDVFGGISGERISFFFRVFDAGVLAQVIAATRKHSKTAI